MRRGLSCTDKRVINYIVCTLTSFCHLNNPTTRAFCRDALKDESHYRKNVLPKVYAAVKQKILAKINEFEHLSFTTDIWSGPKDSYISLTAHGISKNWEKRSFVLSVSAFPGSHTGDRINEVVRGLLKSWDIPLSKTHIDQSPSAKRQRSCAAFLFDAFEEIMSSTSAAQQHSQPDLRSEFMDYAARPREPLIANPLEFWRSAEKELPLMSQAARRFLSPPCTSVLSEQIFSSARDLFHYRRMRTGPKKAEMILFLQRALPIINYKY
uniref:HAT C-terminal dimerisation domain-containing protein n=1 Tax=Globodera rostochiensis TaxID=31243 RepID=A0A914HRX4_GLORO